MELWFLFSAHRLIMLYFCTKFCENISKDLGVLVQTLFPLRNLQKSMIQSIMYVELWFLFSACPSMMLYIGTKFHENILNGIKVIERTRLS